MIASRSGKEILFLYPALLRPHLEHCVRFWAFQYKQEILEILESPVKGQKDDEGSTSHVRRADKSWHY